MDDNVQKLRNIVLVVLVLVALFLVVGSVRMMQNKSEDVGLTQVTRGRVVMYKVSPDGPATGVPMAALTYTNATGGTEQHDEILPIEVNLGDLPRGAFLYISAQKQNNYSRIVVSIYVNGVEVRTATSSGNYGIASVSAIL
jgi:hypothetical protein